MSVTSITRTLRTQPSAPEAQNPGKKGTHISNFYFFLTQNVGLAGEV